jgi:hypothetical protein
LTERGGKCDNERAVCEDDEEEGASLSFVPMTTSCAELRAIAMERSSDLPGLLEGLGWIETRLG